LENIDNWLINKQLSIFERKLKIPTHLGVFYATACTVSLLVMNVRLILKADGQVQTMMGS